MPASEPTENRPDGPAGPAARTGQSWHGYALAALVIGGFVASFAARSFVARPSASSASGPAASDSTAASERIVSLAPSITEALFAIGLGERVVGVTRYCDYPPEAVAKPKVGGYSDPSYEAVAALEPDLVVMLVEHEKVRACLAELDIRTLAVDHRDVSGILGSIELMGRTCGAEADAKAMVSAIRARMDRVERKTARLARPRTMISVGRSMGSGTLKDVFIAGPGTFYDEIITLAGGTNAYQGRIVQYPTISTEGILELNPEVIVDLIPNLEKKGLDEGTVLKEWHSARAADAVKNGRVHVLGEDYVARPGPRFILILEQVARAVHPELDWDGP